MLSGLTVLLLRGHRSLHRPLLDLNIGELYARRYLIHHFL